MRDDDGDGTEASEKGKRNSIGGGSGGSPPSRKESADRPVSVREAMEAQRVAPEHQEPPSATVEADDETWLVRVEGRSRTGLSPDVGVPLLHLTFSRQAEPDRRLREILSVGTTLDELHESELRELLGRARPYRDSWERLPLFPDTHKPGRGR